MKEDIHGTELKDNFAQHQLARALALESAGWGEFFQPAYLKCTDASQENDGLKVKQKLKTDTVDGFRNPANQLIYTVGSLSFIP